MDYISHNVHVAGIPTIVGLLVVMILLMVAATLYFLPSVVAFHRDHEQRWIILLLNGFLAPTGVAWIILLIWSFSQSHPRRA
jgi:hypothetical protein